MFLNQNIYHVFQEICIGKSSDLGFENTNLQTTISKVFSWTKKWVFWFKVHWHVFFIVRLTSLSPVTAYRRIVETLLREPMMTQFTSAYLNERKRFVSSCQDDNKWTSIPQKALCPARGRPITAAMVTKFCIASLGHNGFMSNCNASTKNNNIKQSV